MFRFNMKFRFQSSFEPREFVHVSLQKLSDLTKVPTSLCFIRSKAE